MLTPMNPQVLRKQIQDVLTPLEIYSPDAEEILMATCANESNLGEYRTQAPHGPARGIFQCEGATFNDYWNGYLSKHLDLATSIMALNGGNRGTVDDLVNNDPYAIALCRVHYLREPGALPSKNDIEGIWNYYKKYYNSIYGAATHDVFVQKYNKFVLGK